MKNDITVEKLLEMGYTLRPLRPADPTKQQTKIVFQLYDPEGNPVVVTNNRPCIQGRLTDLEEKDGSR